ncbi:MAG: DNA polymerase III subunit delta' [Lachnospiraceae bacterium]
MAGFEKIIGNEHIKEHFLNAIKSGKIPHSYILNGEDGMGKMMFAKSFAQMLLCKNTGIKPCSECHACKQFESGNHPDLIYVTHEKPSTIGVDDIRNGLINDVLIKPYESQYKIYIVDEAEKLSIQAQNALLKTIEEPPSYAIVFLLTSNSESFLQTIRSRCIVLNLKPVSDNRIYQYLKEHDLDETTIPTIVRFARGNIGKALKMASSDSFSQMIETIMSLLEHVQEYTFEQLLQTVTKLGEYKLSIKDCIDFMQLWFRDVLLYKATNDINLLVFHDEYKYIKKAAMTCSYEGIENIIQSMDKAKRRLDANVNFDLTLELMLLTMKDNQS